MKNMSNHPSSKQIQVLLVDDHPPLRAGIRALLEQDGEIEIVAETGDGKIALEYIATHQPTVTLLDCELSGSELDGPEIAAEIAKQELPTHVLALSSFDGEEYVRKMMAAGVKGYLLKSETTEVILSAVKSVVNGKAFFSPSIAAHLSEIVSEIVSEANAKIVKPTPREQQVLEQLATGLTNVLIAKELEIAERTVAYHVENLLNKLGVNNRTEAVVEAIRRGWLKV